MGQKRIKELMMKATSMAILGSMIGTGMASYEVSAQTVPPTQIEAGVKDEIPQAQVEEVKIYRNSSIRATDPRAMKKFNFNLHTSEPLGIEVLEPTTVEVLITGTNIQGKGKLGHHNVDNLKNIKDIPVGQKVKVDIPSKGQLFLDVNEIASSLDETVPFDFNVEVTLSEGSYMQTPTFDIRDKKISGNVIEDPQAFVAEVTKEENEENGMIMISDNVRMYLPQGKYIPKEFDPAGVLGLHEDAIAEDNRFAGLDANDPNPIHRPRENFILVSARNQQAGYMSAGGQMLDTHPKNSKEYFVPGWGMYHEYGHLYEQAWSYIELWNNMFSKNMAEQTFGFTWLWQDDREAFEVKTIKPFYESYANNEKLQRDFYFTDGLYFFISLDETFGKPLAGSPGKDFVATMERHWRENDNLPLKAEYVAYAMAELYGVNVIPYLNLYGIEINDPKIYSQVIEKSSSTFMYVPNNEAFEAYQNLSVPATVTGIYEGTDVVVSGMSNPGSALTMTVDGTAYTVTADQKGKFEITIPGAINIHTQITIVNQDVDKEPSFAVTVPVKNTLSDNKFHLQGYGDGIKLILGFDPTTQQLIAKSSGNEIHYYFENQQYFAVSFYGKDGTLKASANAVGKGTADDIQEALDGQPFEFGDYIQIEHREPVRAKLYGEIDDSVSDFSQGLNTVDLATSYFYITPNGLRYVDQKVVEPTVNMSAPTQVAAGKTFDVNVSLSAIEDNVYAQDFTVDFDQEVLEFVGVKGVDPTMVVEKQVSEDNIRIIVATEGGLQAENNAVTLQFAPKRNAGNQVTTIEINQAELGTVVEAEANAIVAKGTSQNIKIKEATPELDKQELANTIKAAKDLSQEATIGDKPGQYPQAAKDTLDAAIVAAEQVYSTSTDQATIDQATTTLRTAIQAFKDAVIKGSLEDINQDGKVDVADLALVAYYFQATPDSDNWEAAQKADITGDKKVDIEDLAKVANAILGK